MKELKSQNGIPISTTPIPNVFVCNSCGAVFTSDEYKVDFDLSSESTVYKDICPTCSCECELLCEKQNG